MPETVLVMAGGEPPTHNVLQALTSAAVCVAADSGIDHALAIGLVPEVAVGDFDSVSPEGLARAERAGTVLERHPTAKDETDLELALRRAIEMAPDRLLVAGIGGGRADHQLANLLVVASRRYAGPDIDALVGTARISVVHDRRQLVGTLGELVSLLPVHGDAHGVTATGLGYPLDDLTLWAGSSRGVSNYFTGPTATVSLRQGTLLAIQPDALADPPGSPSG